MTIGTAVAVAGLLITMIVGFGKTMQALGRLEQKFDLVWAWYISETRATREGGRRRTDPQQRWEAHDEP